MARVGSLPTVALVLMAIFSRAPVVSAGSDCYAYHDHAAQYHLDHQAPKYPWDEVDSMMKQNPYLSQVLAKGTIVATSRPPGQQHDYSAVSVVCRSDRFMLKAFTVDNKQCYVIKPQVQQVRYTRCSEKHDRNCLYCNYNKGGVSKCEEDYEWQTVWAYCKPIPKPHPYPQPHPIPPHPLPYPKPNPVPEPRPYPPVAEPRPYPPVAEPRPYPPVAEPRPYPPVAEPRPYPPVAEPRPYPPVAEPKPYHPPKHTGYPVAEPKPYPAVAEPKPYPEVAEPQPYPAVAEPKPYPAVAEPKPYPAVAEPKPYLPKHKGYPVPEPRPYPEKVYYYHYPAKLSSKHYYDPYAYQRWKRSVAPSGKVEKLSLYLPYQCSCKTFKC